MFSGTETKSMLSLLWSVGTNEIVDAAVMHEIDPRLNILFTNFTKFKTNEIEAEKYDSFVGNEFLKPARDCIE